VFVLHHAPTALPRNAARIGWLRHLRDNCLHPLRHILVIAHQNRAGVAGNCLSQALPAVLLHIAKHGAHQVDQVVDDALIGCGGQVVEGDQVPVDDRAGGEVLEGVCFVLHRGDYTESARGFSGCGYCPVSLASVRTLARRASP
jgi:hypothetical protein